MCKSFASEYTIPFVAPKKLDSVLYNLIVSNCPTLATVAFSEENLSLSHPLTRLSLMPHFLVRDLFGYYSPAPTRDSTEDYTRQFRTIERKRIKKLKF